MIYNFITKIKYSWKTSTYFRLLCLDLLLLILFLLATEIFKWSAVVRLTLILMVVFATILIVWLFNNDKLSKRVNQSTILMRYKDHIFIHIYPSPKDKRRRCPEKRRSLASDARTVMVDLPDGEYVTISHESILKRLKKAQNVGIINNLSAKPVYKSSNKRNVSKLYGCCTCKGKNNCSIFKKSKKTIDFYYIEFTKKYSDSEDKVL